MHVCVCVWGGLLKQKAVVCYKQKNSHSFLQLHSEETKATYFHWYESRAYVLMLLGDFISNHQQFATIMSESTEV